MGWSPSQHWQNVWKWHDNVMISLVLAAIGFLQSILIYVPVLLLLVLTADCQLTGRGAPLKHTADRLTASSTQLSLLRLSAQKRIMNDSEWWNSRSQQSSDRCFRTPKPGPSVQQELITYSESVDRQSSGFNTQWVVKTNFRMGSGIVGWVRRDWTTRQKQATQVWQYNATYKKNNIALHAGLYCIYCIIYI